VAEVGEMGLRRRGWVGRWIHGALGLDSIGDRHGSSVVGSGQFRDAVVFGRYKYEILEVESEIGWVDRRRGAH
jgi:hypothetical protein